MTVPLVYKIEKGEKGFKIKFANILSEIRNTDIIFKSESISQVEKTLNIGDKYEEVTSNIFGGEIKKIFILLKINPANGNRGKPTIDYYFRTEKI